jgi:hypothetical protein
MDDRGSRQFRADWLNASGEGSREQREIGAARRSRSLLRKSSSHVLWAPIETVRFVLEIRSRSTEPPLGSD